MQQVRAATDLMLIVMRVPRRPRHDRYLNKLRKQSLQTTVSFNALFLSLPVHLRRNRLQVRVLALDLVSHLEGLTRLDHSIQVETGTSVHRAPEVDGKVEQQRLVDKKTINIRVPVEHFKTFVVIIFSP